MVIIRTSLFINCSTVLDHKTEKANRNMGYVCVFALSVKCEASHNKIIKVDFFLYSKSWYRARRDCNNAIYLETVGSAKKKSSM